MVTVHKDTTLTVFRDQARNDEVYESLLNLNQAIVALRGFHTRLASEVSRPKTCRINTSNGTRKGAVFHAVMYAS